MNTPLSNVPIDKDSIALKDYSGNTLKRRLLLTVLPTALVPLMVASAIGFSVTQRNAKNETLSSLQQRSLLSAKAAAVFLQESFKLPNLVGSNPVLLKAMRSAPQIVSAKKLPKGPFQKSDLKPIEAAFADTKLLSPDPELNTYLDSVVKTAKLGEMFVTERNGFNIAYSNPTSDFVQSDEKWWQKAQANSRAIADPEFDDSAKAVIVALSQAIKDPKTGEFLGVIKTAVLATDLDTTLESYVANALSGSQQVQVVSAGAGIPINTVTAKGINVQQRDIIGGQPIVRAAQMLEAFLKDPTKSSAQVSKELTAQDGLRNVSLGRYGKDQEIGTAQFEFQGKIFNLSSVPNTDWVAIASVDVAEVSGAGRELVMIFALTAILLGIAATWLMLLLARQLSNPLANLTTKAQQVAAGDLDIKAEMQGTVEVQTLASSFNNLVSQVKTLVQQQKDVAEDQRQQRETLETEIFQLVDEIEGAANGDLTVRAGLNSLELSTVADLFNAIIESLRDTAVQVKQSTDQVSISLSENEQAIRQLAEQSVGEAQEIRNTLDSVEQMSASIQDVAENASQAAAIADDSYSTVQAGSSAMEQTVDSILSLRTTVGETAKKMKRLGESSQKISQVVALIDEIVLKTNLLAINASVEASRAGEQGQGFTVVAEQVGALAEQSAAATKEIALIVAAIQAETQEVAEAMELGTSQVVDSTRLVKTTKDRLGQVLEKSQSISQLMQSISKATVSQAVTSRTVTDLMQQVTHSSDLRAASSKEVAEAIQETAQVAKRLESTVAQFRVEDTEKVDMQPAFASP